jgi:cytoskeletal protein CcmA (bactofilin family)
MFNKTNSKKSAPNRKSPAENRKPNPVPAQRVSHTPSILSRDLIVSGDIKTEGDIQIDGRLDGNVIAGNITIGEQGIINGKIVAKSVHVRGKIMGQVDATTVELAETANVQADLIQDQLMIANGAFFDGKCARKTAPSTPPKPPMKPVAPTNPAPSEQKKPTP